jgi:3D-(3,5/4)-trihydroxycyclohexane-1,2-dione acylhydrolase (decyclizing)
VVVIVDNHGYASIGALSRSLGGSGFGTHYRRLLNGRPVLDVDGRTEAGPLPIDLAANAESLGLRVLRAKTIEELRGALGEARAADGPVAIHIEVDRYQGVPAYEGWWDVPVAEVADDPGVQAARAEYESARQSQRPYLTQPRGLHSGVRSAQDAAHAEVP